MLKTRFYTSLIESELKNNHIDKIAGLLSQYGKYKVILMILPDASGGELYPKRD